MVDTKETINTFSKSALTWEGYLTILSGSSGDEKYSRIDQLMELTIDTELETVTHFDSFKKRHNTVTGNNSNSVINLKDTVDIYQKSGDPVKSYLLTDMIKQLNLLKLVPFKFVGIQLSESASDPKFIIETITGDISSIRKRRNLDTGDYTDELVILVNDRVAESADASPEPT